ncbi:hypothetical protein MKZ38_006172 [Zalerion maritima]|uniref:Cyanovirin-N domain-containing protein n=1 Tax=Zalerion maritima TaxID=339359 RepID=A0AAD5RP80_9PEZI|nr:hypothetical protein MKZ38_006172 [Zalerion maritima]
MHLPTLISSSFFLLSACLVTRAAGGGFSLSCPYTFLTSPSLLTSVCFKANGDDLNTEIDLNHCIGNVNGKLAWSHGGGGNFGKSCSGCVLNMDDKTESYRLSCQCNNIKWQRTSTSINLGKFGVRPDEMSGKGHVPAWSYLFG